VQGCDRKRQGLPAESLGAADEDRAMMTARIKADGGWIDVTYDGEAVVMAAVGPPLLFLVKEPTSLPARQKRTQERGRYRRMAMDALRRAGASDAVDDADLTWSHRAG
jgi:hypothetical protein